MGSEKTHSRNNAHMKFDDSIDKHALRKALSQKGRECRFRTMWKAILMQSKAGLTRDLAAVIIPKQVEKVSLVPILEISAPQCSSIV